MMSGQVELLALCQGAQTPALYGLHSVDWYAELLF